MNKSILLALFLAVLSFGQANAQEVPAEQADQEDAKQRELLLQSRELLRDKKVDEAIAVIDRVLAFYEAKYADDERLHFAGRDSPEVLAYLLHAATLKKSAVALNSTNWAEAHYMKGYALLELKHMDKAKTSLENAVAMSPYNSQYVSELAYLYGQEGNWSESLKLFDAALDHAAFTPEANRLSDQSRACRGSGYALVELAQMEAAEKKYLRCLSLDPNDTSSKRELEYVRNQRAKTGTT